MDAIVVRNSGYIRLKQITDGRDGRLCIMEALRDIPFAVKRVYYINHLENRVSIRGEHAHKQLQQAIFCLQGSFLLRLDDGTRRQEILMNRDDLGVLLGPGLWHTMTGFSPGCILLVVASDYYDEADYIRDYEEFLRFVGTERA
ncbi:MAG: WxcM-like domain-containing protein [Zetaproteobacteria bacterium]|nr:MAG: WxcM-like domain-containing protein [Zetaproteobacteria bacterium]